MHSEEMDARSTMMRLGVKTAVISRSVPPMIYGTGARVFRLFRNIEPDDYCIITGGWGEHRRRVVEGVKLPCQYYMLPPEWRKLPMPRRGPFRYSVEWLNIWLRVFLRLWRAVRAMRRERIEAVLTFSGDLEDVPVAFLAAQVTRCRFYIVLDDDYVLQWPRGPRRRFARQVERFVLKRAHGVFVISEHLGDVYMQRYRRSSRVLHTATLSPVGMAPTSVDMPNGDKTCRLVFTGSAYGPSIGSFPSVLTALSNLGSTSATLHLYCSQTEAELQAAGLSGPLVVHPSVGPNEIQKIQEGADILLVTFGFNPGLLDLCRTSFPCKMADYLVSGRPILCIAPSDSYLASYMRTNRCGHLVDQLSPELIARGIRRLIEDTSYRLELVRNAYDAARRDCDYMTVVSGFSEGLRSRW